MRKYLFLLPFVFAAVSVWAQSDDDVYFVPKKAAEKKTVTETYYCGSDRDVDEYNRHGGLYSSVTPTGDDDTFDFDGEEGVYPDSIAGGDFASDAPFLDSPDEDDFQYSRELDRWYGDDGPCVDDPYDWYLCRRLYGYPWYGWWSGWYSPLYYSGLWGWYDPWYYGWWGGWYGWYYPSYWWGGGWWGGHHGWLASGGRGYGYSNRGGRNLASAGTGTVRRNARNAYGDIARRSGDRAAAGSRGTYSSTRTTGANSTVRNNKTTTRSYTSSSRSATRSSGSFSGGSRGGFGGGFGGGGFRGGGGHGGGRR